MGIALKSILTIGVGIFNFITDVFDGIADFTYNLGLSSVTFSSVFNNGLIPEVVSSAVLACLGVFIVLRIIGRD